MESERDAVDPQRRVSLSMSARPTIVLALLVLEDTHLVLAARVDDGRGHGGLVEQGRADLGLAGRAAHEQDLGQGDLLSRRRLETFDVDRVPFADPVLLAAGPDDRVHDDRPPSPNPGETPEIITGW